MNAVRQVTIDANNFVYEKYPGLRERFRQDPTLSSVDGTFGDRLADQSLRHTVHRATARRNWGESLTELPETDIAYLTKMMRSVGFDIGYQRNPITEMLGSEGGIDYADASYQYYQLLAAQRLAFEQLRQYEDANSVLITGQTP